MSFSANKYEDEFSNIGSIFGGASSKIAKEILSLEPTTIIEFYKIYPDKINNPDFFVSFHNGSVFGGSIWWQGQQYKPVPVQITNIESDNKGGINRPNIRFGNLYGSNEQYFSDLLSQYDDFKNARIIRKRTFLRFIDNINFESNINPFGGQDLSAEISADTYLVAQKVIENKTFVEFELTSPLDFELMTNSSRRIHAKYCYWNYRGDGCGYDGPPKATAKGEAFVDNNGRFIDLGQNKGLWNKNTTYSKGDYVFIESGLKTASNSFDLREGTTTYNGKKIPVFYVAKTENKNKNPISSSDDWVEDACSKQYCACMVRFEGNVVPFGGFLETNEYPFRSK